MKSGLIIKSTGGFYYVKLKNGKVYSCRARGNFRHQNTVPYVGDWVEIQIVDSDLQEGYVEQIAPRKNVLTRPPLANLDRLFIVSSLQDPAPDTTFIDKLLSICEHHQIEGILCFNKLDLSKNNALVQGYERIGYQVIQTSVIAGVGIEELKSLLKPGINGVAGFSGVGKSSLLNQVADFELAQIGKVSQKLQRGKHTTRHVELYTLWEDTYLADTPGFSSLEIDEIRKEELPELFIEFLPYQNHCRFLDCTHTKEPGCAVIAAVKRGDVMPSRHENYIAFYERLKEIKEWERNST